MTGQVLGQVLVVSPAVDDEFGIHATRLFNLVEYLDSQDWEVTSISAATQGAEEKADRVVLIERQVDTDDQLAIKTMMRLARFPDAKGHPLDWSDIDECSPGHFSGLRELQHSSALGVPVEWSAIVDTPAAGPSPVADQHRILGRRGLEVVGVATRELSMSSTSEGERQTASFPLIVIEGDPRPRSFVDQCVVASDGSVIAGLGGGTLTVFNAAGSRLIHSPGWLSAQGFGDDASLLAVGRRFGYAYQTILAGSEGTFSIDTSDGTSWTRRSIGQPAISAAILGNKVFLTTLTGETIELDPTGEHGVPTAVAATGLDVAVRGGVTWLVVWGRGDGGGLIAELMRRVAGRKQWTSVGLRSDVVCAGIERASVDVAGTVAPGLWLTRADGSVTQADVGEFQ